ncbi:MAG TPA: CopG family transcriptional regulator [Anaerolineae bacterium]|nr:CopG family transcriptional regulator [Anaerolineae bacterium]
METQNITLALPRKILRQVKTIAAQRHTSVSRLLTEQLEAMLADEQGYTRAQTRHLALLEHAPDLGTRGRLRIKREALHER